MYTGSKHFHLATCRYCHCALVSVHAVLHLSSIDKLYLRCSLPSCTTSTRVDVYRVAPCLSIGAKMVMYTTSMPSLPSVGSVSGSYLLIVV